MVRPHAGLASGVAGSRDHPVALPDDTERAPLRIQNPTENLIRGFAADYTLSVANCVARFRRCRLEGRPEIARANWHQAMSDALTRDQLDGYMALKWEEVYAYEHTPHPVEYQMYYSC